MNVLGTVPVMVREPQTSDLPPHGPLELSDVLNEDHDRREVGVHVVGDARHHLDEVGRFHGTHPCDHTLVEAVSVRQDVVTRLLPQDAGDVKQTMTYSVQQ